MLRSRILGAILTAGYQWLRRVCDHCRRVPYIMPEMCSRETRHRFTSLRTDFDFLPAPWQMVTCRQCGSLQPMICSASPTEKHAPAGGAAASAKRSWAERCHVGGGRRHQHLRQRLRRTVEAGNLTIGNSYATTVHQTPANAAHRSTLHAPRRVAGASRRPLQSGAGRGSGSVSEAGADACVTTRAAVST